MTEELYERGTTAHVNDLDLYYLDEGAASRSSASRLPRLGAVVAQPDLRDSWTQATELAPYLRGFGRSTRPEEVAAYRITNAIVQVVTFAPNRRAHGFHKTLCGRDTKKSGRSKDG
ncbi:MAG: hypothetical protein M3174_05305 [Actinomycetota bacterium]|nr:hypothetical protein [Actinomycetota bacterium]